MTNSAWQATIQDELGNIIPSAEVLVVIESTGLPATIFSDRAGTPLTNPFFANADGFAQFFTIAGEYRITATNSGTGQANTWRYVRMGDAGSRDIGTAPAQVPTNNDLPAFGTAAEANIGTNPTEVPTNNDLGTAAQADVQTSPSDATAGAVLNNETTHIGGQVNYTGANLNPNVFGANGALKTIADGYGATASLAIFFLNTSRQGLASSISVTSTFSILDVVAGSIIASGKTPTLDSDTSNKIVRVRIDGLSGLVTGRRYLLLSDSASSEITVNF